MITTFRYKQIHGNDRVELNLNFEKGNDRLDPVLYQELVDLAQKIKAQFKKETK